MKIFLNDPTDLIYQAMQNGHIHESNDSLVIFKNINSLMNDILLERPKLIITEYDETTYNEMDRIIDICCLHEIPIIILTSGNDVQIELKTKHSSIYVYPTIKGDYGELKKIYNRIKPRSNLVSKIDERLMRFSNRKLPIIFKVVIVFLLLEPGMKIIYLWMMTDFSIFTVLDNIKRIPMGLKFIQFWFLFPISGLLLLFFRKMFFVIFLLLQVYSIIAHLTYQKFTWPYVSKTPHVSSMLLLLINILLIIYLFLSDERKRFADMTKVWWRKQRRVEVDLPCKLITSENEVIDGMIKNISPEGAFICDSRELNIGDNYLIDITDQDISIYSVVRNKRQGGSNNGYGVQFQSLNSKITKRIKDLMRVHGS